MTVSDTSQMHTHVRKWRWIIIIVGGALSAAAYLAWLVSVSSMTVEVELYTDRPERMEVFWSYDSDQFFADKSKSQAITPSRQTTYVFKIDSTRPVDSIRLDPMVRPGQLLIQQVVMTTRWGTHVLEPHDVLQFLKLTNEAELSLSSSSTVGSSDLVFVGLGDDPYFVLPVPDYLYNWNYPRTLEYALIFILAYIAASILIYFLPAALQRKSVKLLAENIVNNAHLSILFLAALVLFPLALHQAHLAKIIPILQGPDERVHVANSVHYFANFFGESYVCGEIWPAIEEADLWVKDIRNDPYKLITEKRVDGLRASFSDNLWSQTDGRGGVETYRSSCASSNFITQFAYNAISIPFFILHPHSHAGDYVLTLRYGQIVVSAFLWVLVFLVIARGGFLLTNMDTVYVNRVRLVVALAAIAYLLIPQNIFLVSVASREAYLVPLGVLVTVSFIFRIKFLSILGAALFAFLIFERRPSYVLPVLMLGLWYLSLFMRFKWRKPYALFMPALLLSMIFLALPFILYATEALGSVLGIRLPDEILGLEKPSLPWGQAIASAWHAYSLGILSGGSFVGVLGSMDTPLPWAVFQRVQGPFWVMAVMFAVWVLVGLSSLAWTKDSLAVMTLFLIAMPIALGIVAYTVFEVYAASFDGHRPWGWGVQGRYFLPLYFSVFLYWYLGGFLLWLYPQREGRLYLMNKMMYQGQGFLMIFCAVLVLVLVAALLNQVDVYNTLVLRYFGDVDMLGTYLSLFNDQKN